MSTLAACQVKIDIDHPDATWQAVTKAVDEAAKSSADIVVLPELAWTGYVFGSIAETADRAEDANGPNARQLRQLSAELGIVLIFWIRRTQSRRPATVQQRGADRLRRGARGVSKV
jgi:5-aminopentanamidase